MRKSVPAEEEQVRVCLEVVSLTEHENSSCEGLIVPPNPQSCLVDSCVCPLSAHEPGTDLSAQEATGLTVTLYFSFGGINESLGLFH